MATPEDVLNNARSTLGHNGSEFWAWYPSGQVAWCCIAVSKWLSDAGLPTHYAWVSGLFDAMRAQGRTKAPWAAQPGDLVAFDYDGNGPGSYDHIALVESVDEQGIVAINGNWTGKVCRVRHYWRGVGYAGGIAEVATPYYEEAAQPAPEVPDLSGLAAALEAAKAQIVRQGSTGDAVKWVQALLNHANGAGLAVDGQFGPMTAAAVRNFQSSRGLVADGIVGPQTWGALTS